MRGTVGRVSIMPTDDERREVAARLRELAEDYDEKVPAWSVIASGYLPTPIDDVFMACGLGRAVHATEICGRLADLIEPEERTCHDVSFGLREFVCSWCGCHLDMLGIESDPTMWLGGSPIEPSFCPNCGAKVVTD